MKDSDIFLLGGLAVIGYVLYTQLAPGASQAPITTPQPVTGTPNNIGTALTLPSSFPASNGASTASTPGPSNGQTSTNPTGTTQPAQNNPGSNDEGDDNYDALAAAAGSDAGTPPDPANSQGDPGDD